MSVTQTKIEEDLPPPGFTTKFSSGQGTVGDAQGFHYQDTESEPNRSTNKGNEDACNSTGDENAVNCKNNGEEAAQDSDIYKQGLGPVVILVPNSDFYGFDRDRSEECFACDQMWAIFDDMDETAWKTNGLPVACGRFKHEKTDKIEDKETFSHKIVWEKGVRNTSIYYPRKGKTWALYKNYSITWSSDPDNRTETTSMN